MNGVHIADLGGGHARPTIKLIDLVGGHTYAWKTLLSLWRMASIWAAFEKLSTDPIFPKGYVIFGAVGGSYWYLLLLCV